MKIPQIILLKGISNFDAVYNTLKRKGISTKIVNPKFDEIISAIKEKKSILLSLMLDSTVFEIGFNIKCPIICWLSDKVIIEKGQIPDGMDLSKFFIFSLDPEDVKRFKNVGFSNSWILPCNSYFDGLEFPKITTRDIEIYGCDISFVGESVTVLHNPYFYFQYNLSNMISYMNDVIDSQVSDFAAFKMKTDYEKGENKNFSLQYLLDFVYMINNKNFELTIGCEASSRLRKKLISGLDGYKVKIYGDEFWKSLETKTIKVFQGKGYGSGEAQKIYRTSKINLNISKIFFSGIIQRVYDIIYCKGFCLTDYRKDIHNWFEPGKEIETYSDPKELKDKIDYYLEHDKERIDIQERGFQRLNKDHRITQRVDFILDKINMDV